MCSVIQAKFIETLETEDGLLLIKRARTHVLKHELLNVLSKMKLNVDQIEEIFEKLSKDSD